MNCGQAGGVVIIGHTNPQVWMPGHCVTPPQVISGWQIEGPLQVMCGAHVAPHVWMPGHCVGPPHVINGWHVGAPQV